MLITRKTKIPTHWVFFAQIPFIMWIGSSIIAAAPFLYVMKKFIDNPAAITFLISLEVFVTVLGSPFVNWLSDRIWTRFGRRKIFVVIGSVPQAITLILIPFAPNLMWLLVLRWLFGIFSDLAAPNQALTMEIVPPKQRGLGSGFFNVQLNLLNIAFWFLVFGRLDDIVFTGPLMDLTSVSGEVLIFLSGGILLISTCFYTFYGIHEVEPPNRKTLTDERKPGENMVKLFIRTFLRDVLGKDLLPLYLLLIVQTLTTINLGILGPLLYTDQWGYTTQQMGSNVAIGALFGIFISLLAGWIADRTSKMKVYTLALIIAAIAKSVWTLYVFNKPDFRPTLVEIIIFSNIQTVFNTLAAVISFPLILDYVERNRLGTAGAGMGLFSGLIRNGFIMLVGFYVLIWSIFFLPQAGDKVELVFNQELPANSVTAPLEAAGLNLSDFDFEPMHRPGVDHPTSRHWKIRRSIEGAGQKHEEIKELSNEIASRKLKLDSPLNSERKKAELQQEIGSLTAKRDAIQSAMDASAAELEEQLNTIYGDQLAVEGQQILAASVSPDGSQVSLTLEIVEPVTGDLTKEESAALRKLSDALDTVDIERMPGRDPSIFTSALAVETISDPANALAFTLRRDPDFVALESTFVGAGIDLGKSYSLISELILAIRETFGQSSEDYEIEAATLHRTNGTSQLQFQLEVIPQASQQTISPEQLAAVFAKIRQIESVSASGSYPSFQLDFDLRALPDSTFQSTGITLRLRSLLPNANDAQIQALQQTYQRIEDSIASRPFYLNTARPIIVTEAVDRQYDYFFSMQFFMIVTDILGIGVVFLLLRLERKGIIRARGAEEDERREIPTAK